MCPVLKHRVILTALLVFIMAMSVALPVAARANNGFAANPERYQYTATHFWYIGDMFHQKAVEFYSIGSATFQVIGRGEARGSQEIHNVQYIAPDYRNESFFDGNRQYGTTGERVYITTRLYGTTSMETAEIDRMEREAKEMLRLERDARIAQLNEAYANNPNMLAAMFERQLLSINNYYDNMYEAMSTGYAANKRNVRLVSEVDVLSQNATTLNVGVEMNAGESGYIRQSIAANQDPNGEYLKLANDFENTGGRTRRDLIIGDFVTEQMRVTGYARVRERAELQDGAAPSGWWNALP